MRSAHTLVLVLILSLASAGAASAAHIVIPTDYDTVVGTFGPLFAGPTVDLFDAALPPPDTIGSLENWVYFDGDIYTYVHLVTPSVDNVSEFNTSFPVLGFNDVAGWSFSDALAAGGLGLSSDFTLEHDGDDTLDWGTSGQLATSAWNAGESITFFFQSDLSPTEGAYQLINSEIGTATSFAPQVPEPGTVLLLGGALIMIALGRRRLR